MKNIIKIIAIVCSLVVTLNASDSKCFKRYFCCCCSGKKKAAGSLADIAGQSSARSSFDVRVTNDIPLATNVIDLLKNLADAEGLSGLRQQPNSIGFPSVLAALCQLCVEYEDEALTLASDSLIGGAIASMVIPESSPQAVINACCLKMPLCDFYKTCITSSGARLNTLFKNFGLISFFEDSIDPTALMMGVVTTIDAEWLIQVNPADIVLDDKRYPAFKINNEGFEAFTAHAYPDPVFALKTKEGHVVYVISSGLRYRGFSLLHYITDLLARERIPVDGLSGLVMPEFAFREEGDISYMRGLSPLTSSSDYKIVSTLQINKLMMNDKGLGNPDSKATGLLEFSFDQSDYVIKKPFIIAVVLKDTTIPYLAAYVDPSCWGKRL